MGINSSGHVDQKQYVTFMLGNENYGIEVLRAKEVLYMIEITKVPNTMNFMKGVIDLRGEIVPLVDLRVKFDLEEKEYGENTVIIIIEYELMLIGMIVDAVSDVLNIPVNDIKDVVHFSRELNIESDYLAGIGRVEEKLIILLDVDRILTAEEIRGIEKNSKESVSEDTG